MFNAYVINLEKDHERFDKLKKSLKNKLNLIRFNAIDGKKVNMNNNNISRICKSICPKSVLGCGLSHIYLSKFILNNDNNDYALVLEDDVYTPEKNLNYKINNIVKNAPKDWEIILLYCQGGCKNYKNYDKNIYEKTFTHGSFAAYLINKKGQEKLSKLKLKNHIDVQVLMFSNIKSYSYNKKLFYTDESTSYNRIDNYKYKYSPKYYYDSLHKNKKNKFLTHEPSFFLNYKLLRIPYFNKELNLFLVLSLVFISLVIMLYRLNYDKNQIIIVMFFLIFIFPLLLI